MVLTAVQHPRAGARADRVRAGGRCRVALESEHVLRDGQEVRGQRVEGCAIEVDDRARGPGQSAGIGPQSVGQVDESGRCPRPGRCVGVCRIRIGGECLPQGIDRRVGGTRGALHLDREGHGRVRAWTIGVQRPGGRGSAGEQRVEAGRCPARPPGQPHGVAGTRGGPREGRPVGGQCAQCGDGDDDLARVGQVTAQQDRPGASGLLDEAVDQPVDEGGGGGPGCRQGQEQASGRSPHRAHVREVLGRRLDAQAVRVQPAGEEVRALDQHVRGAHKTAGRLGHRRVVTGAHDDRGGGGDPAEDPGDECVLAQVGEGGVSGHPTSMPAGGGR